MRSGGGLTETIRPAAGRTKNRGGDAEAASGGGCGIAVARTLRAAARSFFEHSCVICFFDGGAASDGTSIFNKMVSKIVSDGTNILNMLATATSHSASSTSIVE